MLKKIVQLNPLEKGFEVVYGVLADSNGEVNLNFAKLELEPTKYRTTLCTYICNQMITTREDGYKNILVFWKDKDDLKKDAMEESLYVIIKESLLIKTDAVKIAGRNLTEAILEMRAGDTVKVSRGEPFSETYMVVQGGNELFLVKKNR